MEMTIISEIPGTCKAHTAQLIGMHNSFGHFDQIRPNPKYIGMKSRSFTLPLTTPSIWYLYEKQKYITDEANNTQIIVLFLQLVVKVRSELDGGLWPIWQIYQFSYLYVKHTHIHIYKHWITPKKNRSCNFEHLQTIFNGFNVIEISCAFQLT